MNSNRQVAIVPYSLDAKTPFYSLRCRRKKLFFFWTQWLLVREQEVSTGTRSVQKHVRMYWEYSTAKQLKDQLLDHGWIECNCEFKGYAISIMVLEDE